MTRTPIKYLSFFLYVLSLFILCITLYVHKNFLDVNLEQLIFNLALPINGFNDHYLKSAIKFTTFYIIASIILYYIIFKIDKNTIFSGKNLLYTNYAIISFSIVFLIFSLLFFNYKFRAHDIFINRISTNDTFIADNYTIPKIEDVEFSNKKNLILILVESMENTFSDINPDASLTKYLDKIREESLHTTNMQQVYGTNWTIAAFTGWSFGVPLKLPGYIEMNSYISRKGFLPNATNIFDLLKAHGYELAIVMGSDKRYSGLDILLSGHGNFKIMDKNYWRDNNFSLEKHHGSGWGYSDKFILEKALDEYKTLSASGKPFVLIIKTTDTHSPDGYCPEERKRFNDIRDAIVEIDLQLGNFFSAFKKIATTQDAVAMLGDHYLMGPVDFKPNVKQRTIYNAFWGNVPIMPDCKKEQLFTALDVAPTLLHLTGAKWNNNQFGLGVSLFSEEKSLAEIYGNEDFSKKLAKFSDFYVTFF